MPNIREVPRELSRLQQMAKMMARDLLREGLPGYYMEGSNPGRFTILPEHTWFISLSEEGRKGNFVFQVLMQDTTGGIFKVMFGSPELEPSEDNTAGLKPGYKVYSYDTNVPPEKAFIPWTETGWLTITPGSAQDEQLVDEAIAAALTLEGGVLDDLIRCSPPDSYFALVEQCLAAATRSPAE